MYVSGHLHCAQKLGCPLHLLFTMPWRYRSLTYELYVQLSVCNSCSHTCTCMHLCMYTLCMNTPGTRTPVQVFTRWGGWSLLQSHQRLPSPFFCSHLPSRPPLLLQLALLPPHRRAPQHGLDRHCKRGRLPPRLSYLLTHSSASPLITPSSRLLSSSAAVPHGGPLPRPTDFGGWFGCSPVSHAHPLLLRLEPLPYSQAQVSPSPPPPRSKHNFCLTQQIHTCVCVCVCRCIR